ncbi:MAG: hypothetical protein F7C08_01155 [Desulfurococcales archaeon]|nr:hypothetical protein [Desulfurococcales archaeon]MCE4605128.1 hypothetical protein [Desulfurococcales archaeon]
MPESAVVKVELDWDTYVMLREKARREGYTLVSDYARDLLAREARGEAARVGGCGDEKRIADIVARRVERVVSDIVNPFTGKIDEVARRLADLVEKLEGGESEQARAEPVRVEQHRYAQRQQRTGAIDRLRQQKILFWEDVKWMKAPDRLFAKLEKEGAIVFEAGGEKVAVDRGFWDDFVRAVEEVAVRDPGEASILVESALGERARILFEKLVSGGLAYYDEDLGHWIVPQP